MRGQPPGANVASAAGRRRRGPRRASAAPTLEWAEMAKIWVLDTETKGTGANMVPLEKVQSNPATAAGPFKRPGPRPRPASRPPERTPPREFKIVDVVSREVLAEGVGARAA